ncbi:MAG TPA: DUF805 domain-containing protein [Gryllotalpicola sp.]
MSNVPPPPVPPGPPVPPFGGQPPLPPTPPPGYGPTPPGAGEPPLDQPFYGAPFGAAVRRFFTKYAVFSGRASRSEFWWWTLLYVIIEVVLSFFTGHRTSEGSLTGLSATFSGLAGLWNLAIIVPFLALSARRLHDTNRSGWWVLIYLIPIVGWIIVIVWWAGATRPEGARYDVR